MGEPLEERYLFEEMPVHKAVATLAIPTVISQLVTMVYNLADTFFIGQIGNPVMVAAVSLVSPWFNLLTALGNLFGLGGSSLISRMLGAQNHRDVKHVAAFSVWGGGAATLLFSLATYLGRGPLLTFLGASPDTDGYAEGYLFWVVVLGGVPTMVSLTLGHLLRSEGHARQASAGMMFGGILNVVLDPVFIFGLDMGVAGAAIATTLANLTSALLILRQLTRTQDAYRLIPREIRIHKATLLHILGIGVPAAIESAMYAASSLLIQVPINTLGTEAVAAWSATSKVDGVYFALMVSFGVAIMAFVGQNYGAGKYQRMKQGVRVALTISLSITVALSILLMLFAPYCFRIFTDEPLVIQYAIEIMGYFVPFYFLWTCIEILANSLRGSGDALVPMVISVGGICGLRILWVFLVVPHWNTLMGISICYPVSWAVTVAVLILYFCRGKWRRL